MSLLKITSKAMWNAAKLIMTYFLIGPAYYMVLDSIRDAALIDAGGDLLTFINIAYPIFYFAFPTLIVWGLLMVFWGYIKKLRERYYATEEVYYYGY